MEKSLQKKITTTGAFRPSKAFSVISLKKGTVEIAKCAVDVMPQLQFSTKTRTAKKGTTLKVFLPDATTSSSSSNSKVVKNMCNTCYADSRGNHYLKLKCQNKGTATITFQVYPKNTSELPATDFCEQKSMGASGGPLSCTAGRYCRNKTDPGCGITQGVTCGFAVHLAFTWVCRQNSKLSSKQRPEPVPIGR